GAGKESATATQERPSNTQEGLAAAVRDLVAARDDALQTGDGQALAALTAPDSPLRHSDTRLLRQLQQAEVTLGDYRTQVSEIEVLGRQDGQAEVQLVLQQLAHHRGGETEEQRVPAQEP